MMSAHTGPQRNGSWAHVKSGDMRAAAGEFWEVIPADREQVTMHGERFIKSVMLEFQQLICDMHAANLLQILSASHALHCVEQVGCAAKHVSQATARPSPVGASSGAASDMPASGAA
jgi:hypothetical protein